MTSLLPQSKQLLPGQPNTYLRLYESGKLLVVTEELPESLDMVVLEKHLEKMQ